MSDDTGNAGRKRPMGIMLISMLHILGRRIHFCLFIVHSY